jgi:hypothetical protein
VAGADRSPSRAHPEPTPLADPLQLSPEMVPICARVGTVWTRASSMIPQRQPMLFCMEKSCTRAAGPVRPSSRHTRGLARTEACAEPSRQRRPRPQGVQCSPPANSFSSRSSTMTVSRASALRRATDSADGAGFGCSFAVRRSLVSLRSASSNIASGEPGRTALPSNGMASPLVSARPSLIEVGRPTSRIFPGGYRGFFRDCVTGLRAVHGGRTAERQTSTCADWPHRPAAWRGSRQATAPLPQPGQSAVCRDYPS